MNPYIKYILTHTLNRFAALGIMLLLFTLVVGNVFFQLRELSREVQEGQRSNMDIETRAQK